MSTTMIRRGRTAVATSDARSSARRRRARARQALYCSTNGCTSFLQPGARGDEAVCPVCGYRRRLH
ncbi:MAG TPA: hypothetical protein VF763_08980 [Candidatus Limnocylindrales bacterium]